jgi:predicted transcriptional regulator
MTQFAIDDLCHDKKIPTVAKEVLQKLAQSLEQGIQIDDTTLKAFKDFGLCKDLSRYCAHPTI